MSMTRLPRSGLAAATAAFWIAAALPAAAQDIGKLTGDWGGMRTRLFDAGFDFQASYVEEFAGNVAGGSKQMGAGAGQLMLGTTLDLEKLWSVPNAKMQFTVTNRNGSNLVTDADLNTLQLVQEVYGRGDIWRLVSMWYEQSFLDDTIAWKGGRVTVGEDFASFACDFQNLTFCGATPGNLVGNYWFNWPVSQWGTRLRLGKPDAYFQVGAYQVDPRNAQNDGFFLGFEGTTGALIPVEVGWKPSFGGLQGSYTATAWYDTSDADSVYYNSNGLPIGLYGGTPLVVEGRYGVSVHLLQQVYQPVPSDPVRGLSLFLNITQTDNRTSQLNNQVAIGAVYTGLIDSRPRDAIAIAFGRTQVNSQYAATQTFQNYVSPGSVAVQNAAEYVMETYYNIRVHEGVEVRPNFQYIVNPGGVSGAADVVVLGVKAIVNL